MADITSQCQSSAAVVATPDIASLTRDVNGLLGIYRRRMPMATNQVDQVRSVIVLVAGGV